MRRISPDDEPENIDALTRQRETAELLAQRGYIVEHLPERRGHGPNPDYLIEGRVFDCIAPNTANARNIWDRALRKVLARQADRVILNLNDSAVDRAALRRQFAEWPIDGLYEVIVLDGDSMYRIW